MTKPTEEAAKLADQIRHALDAEVVHHALGWEGVTNEDIDRCLLPILAKHLAAKDAEIESKGNLILEMDDEIVGLQAEIERLREALDKAIADIMAEIAESKFAHAKTQQVFWEGRTRGCELALIHLRPLRAALQPQEPTNASPTE
jgi:hypothetical protein